MPVSLLDPKRFYPIYQAIPNAYKNVWHIADAQRLTEGISTFTLRKTYGFLLQWFLTRGSHQSPEDTLL